VPRTSLLHCIVDVGRGDLMVEWVDAIVERGIFVLKAQTGVEPSRERRSVFVQKPGNDP